MRAGVVEGSDAKEGMEEEADQEDEGAGEESESEEESKEDAEARRETHVLKMLYKGNMEEVSRQEAQCKKAHAVNKKHTYYRNTRLTCIEQEESSALPAGVQNVYEDSEKYTEII